MSGTGSSGNVNTTIENSHISCGTLNIGTGNLNQNTHHGNSRDGRAQSSNSQHRTNYEEQEELSSDDEFQTPRHGNSLFDIITSSLMPDFNEENMFSHPRPITVRRVGYSESRHHSPCAHMVHPQQRQIVVVRREREPQPERLLHHQVFARHGSAQHDRSIFVPTSQVRSHSLSSRSSFYPHNRSVPASGAMAFRRSLSSGSHPMQRSTVTRFRR